MYGVNSRIKCSSLHIVKSSRLFLVLSRRVLTSHRQLHESSRCVILQLSLCPFQLFVSFSQPRQFIPSSCHLVALSFKPRHRILVACLMTLRTNCGQMLFYAHKIQNIEIKLDVALAKWQRATIKLNPLYLTCVTVRKAPRSLHVGRNLLGARSLENSRK